MACHLAEDIFKSMFDRAYIYILQSPNRVKVLSRSGIKREGHIKSVYRSHYERNWVLMGVSGALKELKTSQLDHEKS